MTASDWTAIAATTIALAALAVALAQSRDARLHNRIAVRPKLQLGYHFGRGKDYFGLTLKNYGVGPALIDGFRLFVDGTEIHSSEKGGWPEALDALHIKGTGSHYGWYRRGDAIPPGVETVILGYRADKYSLQRSRQLREVLGHLLIEVRYSSFYGESYVAESLVQIEDEDPELPGNSSGAV